MELLILTLTICANLGVGIFSFSKNPHSKTSQFFLGLVLFISLWLGINYLSYHTTGYDRVLFLVRLVMFSASGLMYFLFLTVHNFPDSRLVIKKPYFLGSLLLTLLVMTATLSPYVFTGLTTLVPKPVPIPGPGIFLFAFMTLLYFTSSGLILYRKFQNSTGERREQIKYLIGGLIITFGLIILTNFLLVVFFNITNYLIYAPSITLFFVFSTSYAIVAHHLFDIRLIIKRTVVYTILLGFIFLAYSTIIFLFTQALQESSPTSSRNFIANLLAATLIGFTLEPLRRWLEDRTDRFLFKKQYEEQTVLKELAKRLNNVIALDEALDTVMQTVVKVLHLQHAVTFVFQAGEHGAVAIKQIKQIGYSSTASLFLNDRDFTVSFFGSHPGILLVEDFKHKLENERYGLEKSSKDRKVRATKEATILIRDHAIQQSVLKKLESMEVSVAIPLHLNEQPIGLILISDKLSGDAFTREDLALLETIGAQAISSIQKAKLYEGDQMKSEFVSIASHELLTPISAMEGYLSMILDENLGQIDNQARDYLNKVYASAKRLSVLIKDLLSVSRIESGKMKVEPQQLDISQMINETVDQLKFVAQEKHLTLSYTTPPEPLPPVWADPDRTIQVLVNLVSNAIKYTQKGSVTISATVAINPSPHVRIDIVDTGLGMSKQQHAHLFEKFYRVDSPETTGIAGTGLGLYITKSIVERMGGSIFLKSEPGKGSTFTFTLPLFKVESSKAA